MGKFKKDCIIDYTREEFLKKYNINDKYLEKLINSKDKKGKTILEYYNIDKDLLKRDSSSRAYYEIQYDIADLFKIMVKNFKSNPFYDSRYNLKNSTSEQIIEYNKKIINEIEKLPEYKQAYIKKSENYKFNYLLTKSIPVIIDKLSFLLNASLFNYDDFIHMTSIIGKLLDGFDFLIDECFFEGEKHKWVEENLGSGKKRVNNTRYSIDYVVKDCFNYFIRDDLRKFNSIIPKEMKNKLIDNNLENNIEELRNAYREEFDKATNKKILYKVNNEISNFIKNIRDIEEMIEFDKVQIETLEKNKIKIAELINFGVNLDDETFNARIYNIDLDTFIFKIKKERDKFLVENSQDKFIREDNKYINFMTDLINNCVEDIIDIRRRGISKKYEKLQNKKERKLKLIRKRLDYIFGRILIDTLEDEI